MDIHLSPSTPLQFMAPNDCGGPYRNSNKTQDPSPSPSLLPPDSENSNLQISNIHTANESSCNGNHISSLNLPPPSDTHQMPQNLSLNSPYASNCDSNCPTLLTHEQITKALTGTSPVKKPKCVCSQSHEKTPSWVTGRAFKKIVKKVLPICMMSSWRFKSQNVGVASPSPPPIRCSSPHAGEETQKAIKEAIDYCKSTLISPSTTP